MSEFQDLRLICGHFLAGKSWLSEAALKKIFTVAGFSDQNI